MQSLILNLTLCYFSPFFVQQTDGLMWTKKTRNVVYLNFKLSYTSFRCFFLISNKRMVKCQQKKSNLKINLISFPLFLSARDCNEWNEKKEKIMQSLIVNSDQLCLIFLHFFCFTKRWKKRGRWLFRSCLIRLFYGTMDKCIQKRRMIANYLIRYPCASVTD